MSAALQIARLERTCVLLRALELLGPQREAEIRSLLAEEPPADLAALQLEIDTYRYRTLEYLALEDLDAKRLLSNGLQDRATLSSVELKDLFEAFTRGVLTLRGMREHGDPWSLIRPQASAYRM